MRIKGQQFYRNPLKLLKMGLITYHINLNLIPLTLILLLYFLELMAHHD